MSDEEDYNYEEEEDPEEDTRSDDENREEIEEEDEDARSEDLDELYLIYHQFNNEQDHYYNNEEQNDDPDPNEDEERNERDESENNTNDENITTRLYDRLYDIFHIHTSNERLFNSIGSNENRYARTYSNVVNNNIGNLVNMECPVCAETLHVTQLTNHLVYQHTTFYISLNMLMNPSLSMDDIQNVVNTLNNNPMNTSINAVRIDNDTYDTINRLMFSEDDNASYEDLLNLCDYIGYHKPGVNDIDQAAPLLDDTERANLICNDDTCRICLEELYQATTLRKIKICEHIFCSDCIHQWFKENKTCPLCNIDVCPDETKETLIKNINNVNNVNNLDSVD